MVKTGIGKMAIKLSIGSMLLGLATPFGIQTGQAEAAGIDYAKVPKLLITELVPDTANVSGSDAYEFIEIYNNSLQTVDLKDYQVVYDNAGTKTDYNATDVSADLSIPSKGTIVLWLMNGTNAGETPEKFVSDFYAANPPAMKLVKFNATNGGMANSGTRGVLINGKDGHTIVSASYTSGSGGTSDSTDIINPEKGLFYSYPTDGSVNMTMVAAGEFAPGTKTATPGLAEPALVPPFAADEQAAEPTPGDTAIAIVHTPVAEAIDDSDIELAALIGGGSASVSAAVYYKLESESDYDRVPMTVNPDRATADAEAYEAAIPHARLTESKLNYYIEASDGTASKSTDVYSINVRPSFNYSYVPALLVTELNPNSSNTSYTDSKNNTVSGDGYEFIEIYNNTSREIDLKDYKLMYRYTDKTPNTETRWETGSVPIPSQQSAVLWIDNGTNVDKTAADFNAKFGSQLTMGVDLFKIANGGMANGGARSIVIRNSADTQIISAHYEAQVKNIEDKTIFYKYPDDGTTEMILDSAGVNAATPGAIEAGQVPKVPVELPEDGANEPPVIVHTPVTTAEPNVNLQIQAEITNKESEANQIDPIMATVYYKTASQSAFAPAAMAVTSGHTYLADIPRSELTEETLQYYIEVKDAKNTVHTDTYTVNVNVPDFDPSKVPPLLVTELLPNSANVGGADGYEFIELYNNTDKPINLKDYKLYYRYPDSGPDADLVWPTDREDLTIDAGKTLVFWIINSANSAKTAADFNAQFGTSLVEGQDLFRMYSDGMSNSAKRAVVIGTNTHVDISSAQYDGTITGEVADSKAIVYKFPTNGSTSMIKLSAGSAEPTPGAVDAAQVPSVPVSTPADDQAPAINDLTGATSLDQSKNLAIVGEATDDVGVKSVKLFYRTDKQTAFASRYLYRNYNDAMYHFTIYSPDLIGKSYVEYYYQVSDGVHTIDSPKTKVAITGGQDRSDLRLNLKDGDIVSGTQIVKGTAEQAGPDTLSLKVDGKDVNAGAYRALESDASFAFEANSVNYYFKNGVTIGQEILYTFMDPINEYTTLTVPIEAGRLKEGANVVSIRAGTKSSPFDDRPEENKDDFTVKNVRLVLSDGSAIYDARYGDASKEIKMGDSAGKNPFVDFSFQIPAELLKSRAYDWDTTGVADGAHEVLVDSAVYGQVKANVRVDNTAPAIVPTIEDGKTYRGAFALDASVTDAIAGVKTTEATLDGQAIELPYNTSSAKLSPGAHRFKIEATDAVGNASVKDIAFEVPDENPLKPQLVSPASESTAGASLSVRVTDPTNDAMKVGFFKGYLFDADHRTGLEAFKNATEYEPPAEQKPAGETAFTEEDYAKIASADGEYLSNDSDEKFPYHRFDVKLDPSVKATDNVEIDWQGKSLEGRQVSMYAWSPAAKKWNKLTGAVAGSADFALTAEVPAGDYADGSAIHVIVQDEVPVSQDPYDFSFVWMSDTQYYSESYPEIYEGNVKWIVDHKDDMNIKYVIHTGDIVDEADKEYQWVEADKDMKVLEDGGVPYGVLAGNHDVSHQYADYTKFYQYFGENRFNSQPTYGGSYENNRGHYDLISAGGNDFVVIYMGWDIRDQDIQWMDDVVKAYPDRKAILDFHEYLLVSANRAPISDKIYERVVVPNKNVIAVLSGHYHDAEKLVDEIDDDGDGTPDRKVYQLLADYQGAEKGGLGYIRLLQFDIKNNKIHVKTYSPYLDDYNYYDPTTYPGKDEFDLDVDLQPMTKQVATDYFGIKVYTGEKIGTRENVASGELATVTWPGVEKDGYYQWYAVAEDANSGAARSDIWGFTAAASTPGTEPTPSTPTPSAPTPSTEPTPSTTPTPTPTPTPNVPPQSGAAIFKDVGEKYAWADEAIGTLAAAGIIQGVGASAFEPAKPITRADFMMLLVRMLNLSADAEGTIGFADVSPDDYFYETLGIVKTLGITTGVGDNKFNPREAISRQDMMVLIARALEVSGKMALTGQADDLIAYKDRSSIASYAKDAVAAMVRAGIVEGSGGQLKPEAQATRAETAALLYRIYKQL